MGKNVFVAPTAGIFLGLANANKGDDKESKGSGGLILGDFAVQLGGLLGGIVGFGQKFGLYTGLNGGVALLPFLGFGFIGIPIGFHINRKFGLGIVLPVYVGEWYIGLILGLIALGGAFLIAKNDTSY